METEWIINNLFWAQKNGRESETKKSFTNHDGQMSTFIDRFKCGMVIIIKHDPIQ